MKQKSSYVSWGFLSLALLVTLGGLLRVGYNSVVHYGNGDEYHYRLQVQALCDRGWSSYPELVGAHLTFDPNFPAPYRWGYLAMGSLGCYLRGACDERSLAWLSTLAGLAVVGLVAILGLQLFGRRTAVVATALAATSPLHLELSRRAFVDELHTACVLLSVLALFSVATVRLPRQAVVDRCRAPVLAILALTLAWSVKESVVFLLPALAVWLFWLRQPPWFRRTDALLVVIPPAIAVVVFAWLNHGVTSLWGLLSATRYSFLSHYSALHQYGPPHRPLIELFTLSPWVFGLLPVAAVFAFGGVAGESNTFRLPGDVTPELAHKRAQALILMFAMGLAPFLILPKNVRFYAVLDPMARLLVSWLVCEALPWGRRLTLGWWSAILLCHAAFELALFHRTFVVTWVTDPTASAIFRALQLVPGEGPEKRWHPPAVVLACGLLSACSAWVSTALARFSRRSLAAAFLLSLCALGLPQLFRPFGTIGMIPAEQQER
jgi:hypothetical protein